MRETRSYGSARGVRSNPYPYRDKILPVRSTVLAPPQNRTWNHAFTARTEGVDSSPAMSFFGYTISVHKLMQNPRPIMFGIGVLAGMLSRWDRAGRTHGVRR
jgi:hypothetical protein